MATIQALTPDAKPLELDAALVQGLRGGLRGPVQVAGDPGYDETRAIWNAAAATTSRD